MEKCVTHAMVFFARVLFNSIFQKQAFTGAQCWAHYATHHSRNMYIHRRAQQARALDTCTHIRKTNRSPHDRRGGQVGDGQEIVAQCRFIEKVVNKYET